MHQFLSNPGGFEIGGSGEYFLVENRQQVLFDSQLGGCGILVWHLEESQTGNQNGGHTTASHRLVDIDEADGLAELDQNLGPDDGDPFPGSTNNCLVRRRDESQLEALRRLELERAHARAHDVVRSSMQAAFGPNQPPVADAGGPYNTDEGIGRGARRDGLERS